MSASEALWLPPADWRASTLVGELCQRVGAGTFQELRAMSLERPPEYWQSVMAHIGFRWRETPSALVDLSEGPAFPRWFPGGRLNWLDNVLAQADGPQALQSAVITESEGGGVTTLSYAALANEVRQLAAGLAKLGVARGDRVGLMMTMGGVSVSAFLGIAAIGAIAVPLFTGFGADAAASRLDLAGAGWLLATRSFQRRNRRIDLAATLHEVQQRVPGLQVLVHGEPIDAEGFHEWSRSREAPPLETLPSLDANHPFMIVFTSGTTGQPKGTVHTHGGFPLKILHDVAYHFELRSGDRWLWPSDMGWIVGPITTVGALCRGASLVCYDGAPDWPRAGRLAEIVDHHRVTHFGASPTLIRSLAAMPDAIGPAVLDSLRVLMVAGEVIDPDHFEWFFQAWGRGLLPVINYSGGTEASGGLVANVLALPIASCAFNTVSPGVDLYAADEAGHRLRGTLGELVIAAPFIGMTAGFWQDKDRYLDTYWRERPGLWTHGDLLLEQEDGQLFILGRSDDTLKIAGKRVGPAEVEAIVLELPIVQEAAAVAVPHSVKGEQLVVCVVPRGDPPPSLAVTVASRIETALGKPFRPAVVHLVEALPRTRNGKVMRRVVRNLLRGLPLGDLSSLENPASVEAIQGVVLK